HGKPFAISVPGLCLHLGYLNALAQYEWVNPVYWTLAIECQFYLLIGLCYPLLVGGTRTRLLVITVLVLLARTSLGVDFICHYMCLFLMGILTFLYRARFMSQRHFLVGIALLAVAAHDRLGLSATAAGVLTSCTIAYVEIRSRILQFLGGISYSL